LFERVARGNGAHRPVISPAQRALLLRRVIREARLDGLVASARFAGFADSLGAAVAELEAALLGPDALDGELAALYGAYREELEPRSAEYAHPALARLERLLFEEAAGPAELDGAVRFLEGAGSRGTLELVADEILELLRAGTPPEAIGIVCPNVDRVRAAL